MIIFVMVGIKEEVFSQVVKAIGRVKIDWKTLS